MDGMGEMYSWRRMASNLLAAYGANWIWVTVMLCLLSGLVGQSLVPNALPYFSASIWLLNEFGVSKFFAEHTPLLLFFVLFFAPVVEEAIFRMLPLTIVKNSRPDVVRAVVIVVCGIAFGWAHGSPLNVFIQGAGGMILGWLYLKNSRNQLTSYLSCVIVHAMYNFTVVMTSGG